MDEMTSKKLKRTLKILNILYVILKSKYKQTFFCAIHLYLWCVNKMQLHKLQLKKISSRYNVVLFKESNTGDLFVGDSETCGFVSPATYQLLGSKRWHCILDAHKSKNFRILHILPHSSVKDGLILLKEDIFYNFLNNFHEKNMYADNFSCLVYPLVKEDIDDLATSVKVSTVLSSCDWASEDESEVLHAYFKYPRYLRKGDIFSVPLSKFAPLLKKSGKYYNVSEIHFKVQQMSTEADENTSQSLYVLKNHCDLFCTPSISSYLPSINNKFCSITSSEQPLLSPDLTKYGDLLRSMIKPFIDSRKLDIRPMYLLSGVHGSGKSKILKATANRLGMHLLIINCYEFHGIGVSTIEAKFEFIFKKAAKIGPCIIALTNLELLGRDKNNKEDSRVISSFLHHALTAFNLSTTFPLVLIGVTTQKPDQLLPSLLRAFVQTIKFQVPKPEEIVPTLEWLIQDRGCCVPNNTLDSIATKLIGYVHEDLELLVRQAIRIKWEQKHEGLLLEHFERAVEIMEAAYSDSIGAAKVPSVHWNDVGGLNELKEEISLTLSLPQRKPQLGKSGGLRRSGILFYGPPGTGKTLMAKAVATECAMNFLSVKGPELMNMYVGQSERNVREVFERAREATPCILFFDELDSLAPNRGKSGDGGGVTDRVVSQLLAEMDGLQSNKGLFVIAATNRPDLVDPALLRPGRFDKMFYLGPCMDVPSKVSVLEALTKKFLLSKDVELSKIAEKLPTHVTGADLYSVCSNAWLSAARRNILLIQKGMNIDLPLEVSVADFERGLTDFTPSLTEEDLKYYEKLSSSSAK